jgi:tetratricopeptide (TPR) repeat protein
MNCDTIEELERYWQIQAQALGKFSPEVAITIAKLANLYLSNGDFDRAQFLHQRALDIKLKSVGSDQSEIDESRRSLERVKEAREKSEKSRLAKVQSATTPQNLASNGERSQLGQNQINKASSHARKNAGPNAIKELELEITLLKQIVGNEHSAVADGLTKLADLYCRAKVYTKMEPLLLEALRIRESLYGPNHPNVATELKNIAQLYTVQGRYAQAEPPLLRAIRIRETNLGVSHAKVIVLKDLLIKLMKKTNRTAEARELEVHLRQLKKKNSSPSARVDDTVTGALS